MRGQCGDLEAKLALSHPLLVRRVVQHRVPCRVQGAGFSVQGSA